MKQQPPNAAKTMGAGHELFSAEDTAHRIFDAIPSPAFIMDGEQTVLASNGAAGDLMKGNEGVRYRMKGGAALDCIHSTEHPQGCGYAPLCENCAIRIGVGQAIEGARVWKRKYKLEQIVDGKPGDVYVLISASPIELDGRRFALVILEDVSELSQLRNILPICSKCKKIRDSDDYWESVDTYLRDHENLSFSHSLCPQCAEELYPGLTEQAQSLPS